MRKDVCGTKHLILIFQENQLRIYYAIVKHTTKMKQIRHTNFSTTAATAGCELSDP